MNWGFLAWTGPLESIDKNGGMLSNSQSTRGSWSWWPSPSPFYSTTCSTWSSLPLFQVQKPSFYVIALYPYSLDYLRVIGAWDTHEVNRPPVNQKIVNKIVHNSTGDYRVTMINRTTKINVNGILIEYEGEDSGIGLLFASKAAVQVSLTKVRGWVGCRPWPPQDPMALGTMLHRP